MFCLYGGLGWSFVLSMATLRGMQRSRLHPPCTDEGTEKLRIRIESISLQEKRA